MKEINSLGYSWIKRALTSGKALLVQAQMLYERLSNVRAGEREETGGESN